MVVFLGDLHVIVLEHLLATLVLLHVLDPLRRWRRADTAGLPALCPFVIGGPSISVGAQQLIALETRCGTMIVILWAIVGEWTRLLELVTVLRLTHDGGLFLRLAPLDDRRVPEGGRLRLYLVLGAKLLEMRQMICRRLL